MTCADVSRALIQEPLIARLSAQVQEHIAACDSCRELMRATNSPVSAEVPAPTTLRQIESAIAGDLRPVRPISVNSYWVALILIFVCVVALAVYRIGAFALAVMTPLQTATILGALAIAASLMSYSVVQQIIPGSRHRISPKLLPMCILILLAVVITILFHFQSEQHFWASAWSCIITGTSIGALTAVFFLFVLRCGAILSPRMTGVAIGLLAGLVGTTTLEIHCPNLEAGHILVSHVGVALIGVLIGYASGLWLRGDHLPSPQRPLRRPFLRVPPQ